MQNQTIGIIVVIVAIIIVLYKIFGTRENKQVCTEACGEKAPTFPVTKKEIVAPTPAPETTVKPVKKAVKKVATKKVVKKTTKK